MNVAHVELRKDQFDQLRRKFGLDLDAELARHIGVHQSSLLRVLNDTTKPGIPFVAGACLAFGGEKLFEKLFVIVEDHPGE